MPNFASSTNSHLHDGRVSNGPGGAYQNQSNVRTADAAQSIAHKAGFSPRAVKQTRFGPNSKPHVVDLIRQFQESATDEQIKEILNPIIADLVNAVVAIGNFTEEQVRGYVDPPPPAQLSSPAINNTPELRIEVEDAANRLNIDQKLQTEFDNLQDTTGFDDDTISEVNDLDLDDDLVHHEFVKAEINPKNEKIRARLLDNLPKLRKSIDALDLNSLSDIKKSLDDMDLGVSGLAKEIANDKEKIITTLRAAEIANRVKEKMVEISDTLEKIVPSDEPSHKKTARELLSGDKFYIHNQNLRQVPAAGLRSLKEATDQWNVNTHPIRQAWLDVFVEQHKALTVKLKQLHKDATAEVEGFLTQITEANERRDDDLSKALNESGLDVQAKIYEIEELQRNLSLKSIKENFNKASLNITALKVLHSEVTEQENSPTDLRLSLAVLGNRSDPAIELVFSGLNAALKAYRIDDCNHVVKRIESMGWKLHPLQQHFNAFCNDGHIQDKADSGSVKALRYEEMSNLISGSITPESNKFADFLGTPNGAIHIHACAANNLIAAGFNTHTFDQDAPSLSHKADQKLSFAKRYIKPGYGREVARNPEQEISSKLAVVASVSKALQAELYHNGKPVNITSVILTEEHALEASSLVLASIPTDVLINNHQTVSQFMLKVKKFETDLAAHSTDAGDGPIQHRKLPDADFDQFKTELVKFHSAAADWISKRNTSAETKYKSIKGAEEKSALLADGRKSAITIGVKAIANALTFGHKKESGRREQLSKLVTSELFRSSTSGSLKNFAELTAALENIRANEKQSGTHVSTLLSYLETGKPKTIRFDGNISDSFAKELIEVGKLMNAAWKKAYPSDQRPHVIVMTREQYFAFDNLEGSDLREFVEVKADESDKTTDAVSATDEDATATAAPTLTTTTTAAAAAATPAAVPEPDHDQTITDWVTSVWKKALNAPGVDHSTQCESIITGLIDKFNSDHPSATSIQLREAEVQARPIRLIADEIDNQDPGTKPGREALRIRMLPALLNLRKGELLTQRAETMETQPPQQVRFDGASSWVAATIGSVVHRLTDEDEFVQCISEMGDSLPRFDLSRDELQEIHESLFNEPSDGSAIAPETIEKLRDFMIDVVAADGKFQEIEKKQLIQKIGEGDDALVDSEFVQSFMKALKLPVLVNRSGEKNLDVSLPSDYVVGADTVVNFDHPKTWPALHHNSTANGAHWSYYKPIIQTPPASTSP
jgi:hypothetical protein